MTTATSPRKTNRTKTAAAPEASAPVSVRDRLAARTRPTSRLTICDDDETKKRLLAAQFDAQRARAAADRAPDDVDLAAAAETARQELEEAQAAYDAAAIVLRFQALPRPDFEALKRAHPPTEEQAEDGAAFNAETLAPELISAASLDGITVDEARGYLDTWAAGEAVELYEAAFGIQHHSRMDLGKG